MTSPTSCPAPEQALLQDLLDGVLEEATARRVTDHAATCAHCGPELADLREFEAVMRSAHLSSDEVVEAAWGGASAAESHLLLCSTCRDEVQAVKAARTEGVVKAGRSWAVPLALAATLVVALGLISLNRPADESGPSTIRGEGLEIRGLVPQGETSRAASELVFSWQGVAGSRYSVSFFSADGRSLARVMTAEARVVMSADDRAKLEAEPAFFWKVETIGTDVVAASQLERVTWRP